MAQSLFISLQQRYAKPKISVLAPDWTSPLLARMPEVDQTITAGFQHGKLGFFERRDLGIRLRASDFNQAIILPGSLKSALVPFWARIPVRTGYIGEFRWGLINDKRTLNKEKLPLTVQRFVALGLDSESRLPPEYLIPKLLVDQDSIHKTCERLNIKTSEKPILALCPGAEFGPAKRWPAEHFASLAKYKLLDHWQVWLFGSNKDRDAAEHIQSATKNQCTNLVGETTLAEAIDLLSLAHTVVSNDSGLMHVAAALDTKLVALFGSSSPEFTPPLGKVQRVIHTGIDCSPCFKRTCPFGHTKCLTELSPESVSEAVSILAA